MLFLDQPRRHPAIAREVERLIVGDDADIPLLRQGVEVTLGARFDALVVDDQHLEVAVERALQDAVDAAAQQLYLVAGGDDDADLGGVAREGVAHPVPVINMLGLRVCFLTLKVFIQRPFTRQHGVGFAIR